MYLVARIDALYEEEIARRTEAMRQAEEEARTEIAQEAELSNNELHRRMMAELVAAQTDSPGRKESEDATPTTATTTNVESSSNGESVGTALLDTPGEANSRITQVGETPSSDPPSVDNATGNIFSSFLS